MRQRELLLLFLICQNHMKSSRGETACPSNDQASHIIGVSTGFPKEQTAELMMLDEICLESYGHWIVVRDEAVSLAVTVDGHRLLI